MCKQKVKISFSGATRPFSVGRLYYHWFYQLFINAARKTLIWPIFDLEIFYHQNFWSRNFFTQIFGSGIFLLKFWVQEFYYSNFGFRNFFTQILGSGSFLLKFLTQKCFTSAIFGWEIFFTRIFFHKISGPKIFYYNFFH